MNTLVHRCFEQRTTDARTAINGPEPGDLIELKCRHWQCNANQPAGFAERWITGEVIYRDDDSWPIVRLTDGQITELRPFMSWRMRS